MSRFGDGLATGPDLVLAAEAAVAQALAPLAGRPPDLTFVFVSGGSPDEVAAAAERAAQLAGPGAVVGCSADGVLAGERGVEGRGAVSVWSAVLPGVRVRPFHLEVLRVDAGLAVVGFPEREHPPEAGGTPERTDLPGSADAPDRPDDEVVVLLADPYSFPADGFVGRANEALAGLPVVGGLASGPAGAGSTRLLVDGRVVDRGAVGVLLGGSGARTIVSQGCRPVGPAMTVTGARGNVLTELAGVPVVERVQHLLSDLSPLDQALASQGLHLGLAADEYVEAHDYVIRSILGTDPDTGGLVVGDLVEVGQTVRLQVRDAEAADADLRRLLARHRADTRDAPVGGALLFSCNGRGAHLFGPSHGGADHDPSVVRHELAAQGVGGFFAGGELGPVAGRNHLHGFTASLLAFPA